MSSRTPKANIDSWRKLFTFVLFLSVCRNGAGDGREVLKKYSGFGGNDTDRNYRNCRNDSNGGEYRPKGSKNGTGNGKISVLNIRVIVQGDSSHSSVGANTNMDTSWDASRAKENEEDSGGGIDELRISNCSGQEVAAEVGPQRQQPERENWWFQYKRLY